MQRFLHREMYRLEKPEQKWWLTVQKNLLFGSFLIKRHDMFMFVKVSCQSNMCREVPAPRQQQTEDLLSVLLE